MKRAEFLQIVKKAKNLTISETVKVSALDLFFGCALHRDRIISTVEQFAYILRYQALQFNNEWDNEELANMAEIAKRVDLV